MAVSVNQDSVESRLAGCGRLPTTRLARLYACCLSTAHGQEGCGLERERHLQAQQQRSPAFWLTAVRERDDEKASLSALHLH